MHRISRLVVLLLVVLIGAAPTLPALAQDGGEITLTPFEDATFGIRGLTPEGWIAAGPGTYVRDATTVLVQQAAPAPLDQLTTLLVGQLGLEALPEASATRDSDAFSWTLYEVGVEQAGTAVTIGLAVAEAGGSSYVILLIAAPDEFPALYDSVFLPVVDALAPLAAAGDATDEAEEARYEDPDGRFSVPVPTNWTAEQSDDGYGILTAPDGDVVLYALALEADSMAEGVAAAWVIVDPDFDLEVEDVVEAPPSGLQSGAETAASISYDSGDEDVVVAGGGWLYDGTAYVLLLRGSLDTVERRQAQLSIINSGFTINALEVTDLSAAEPLPIDDAILAEMEDYITTMMDRLDVPGLSIAIVQDDEVIYSNGFGVRDYDSNEPVTPETLMMIGSTTKTMTTMLMASLVDEGLMAWDTPVVDILPSFALADPDLTQHITVENLVCACTGVPRRDLELFLRPQTAESIVESLATFELFTDFGEAFQYSNQMVAAGGYVAAVAAGVAYGDLYDGYLDLMQERIFDPIGMSRTMFTFEDVMADGNYALPYSANLEGSYDPLPLRFEGFATPIAPAGAAWSNVLDMARYIITELNEGVAPDGARVVSAENLGHTWTPQVPITADTSYGLGWIIGAYKGVTLISHGGNTLGFTSELAFLPEHGLGISVLTNQQGSLINQAVAYWLLETIYEQEHEVDAQIDFALNLQADSLASFQARLQPAVDAEAVAPYLGTFSNDALGAITLSLSDDGTLLLDVDAFAGEMETEVRAVLNDDGETHYITYGMPLAGLGLDFTTDDAGEPVIVLGGGATEYTFTPVE